VALTFIPEIWSALVLETLKKNLVFAQPGVVNRDYEGEITQQGDTVRIRSFSDPTISTYSKNSTLTYETLTDAQRALLIDQAKSFSFSVDDIDKAQGPGGELETALTQATYKLRDVADQYVAGLYTGAAAANAIGTVAVTTAALAYTQLRKLSVKLDEADVPQEGRWVVVPPWYHGLLLEEDKFVRVDASGTDQGLRNGIVGRALGFDVMKSNNAVLVTGDDYAVMAGHPMAISYAEQILEVETLRLQTTFGTGVRGLHVYGAKLVRPTAIATVVASIT
jgi:hypothetical protein